MFGQATHRCGPFRLWWHCLRLRHRGGLGFELFERELKLFDLAGQLLRRCPERHPPQPRDLDAERLDQQIAGGEFRLGTRKCRRQSGDLCVPIRV